MKKTNLKNSILIFLFVGASCFAFFSCAKPKQQKIFDISSLPKQQKIFADSASPYSDYLDKAYKLSKKGKHIDAAKMYEKIAQAEKEKQEPDLFFLSGSLTLAGNQYRQGRAYELSIKNHKEALEIAKKSGKQSDVIRNLDDMGLAYQLWGKHKFAIKFYQEVLIIERKLGKEVDIAKRLTTISAAYLLLNNYKLALANSYEALEITNKLGKKDEVSTNLLFIGNVYGAWGKYDQAIKSFQESLEINRELKREVYVAVALNNIASIYQSWGKYDLASKNYLEALKINEKFGTENMVFVYRNIGSVYHSLGKHELAIWNLNKALEIAKKLGNEWNIAKALSSIGAFYIALSKYDLAIKNFQEALEINKKLGQEAGIALNLIAIGYIYGKRGRYDRALDLYNQALEINKKIEAKPSIAGDLQNIGEVYFELGQYNKAVQYFDESVKIKEKLRKTAPGDIRLNYLASQIYTYQFLISAYMRSKDINGALRIIELSRAKLLSERLAGVDEIEILPAEKIQSKLSKDSALLMYANANLDYMTEIILTKNKIAGLEVSNESFIKTATSTYGTAINTLLKNQRGIKIVKKGNKEKLLLVKKSERQDKKNFEDIINYYHALLMSRASGGNRDLKLIKVLKGSETDVTKLARELYNLLIKPVESEIKGKKNLIISPDGILAYLPFETLIDEAGNYLIEKYNITYTQSAGILELLNKRKYDSSRKPLLAFGGAVYDEITYDTDIVKNTTQLAYLTKNVHLAIEQSRSVREAYSQLGIASWANLPGTLVEVNAIQRLVEGAKIYTGANVTESKIKKLSETGELAKYKVLHFATHGLVLPEMPELSAIVLSQFKDEKNGEDGYLRMGEIAELNIKADFVNLSACKTGLGKIYGGEGVVGLTQSFLLAGANAISVSLWSVEDVSTSQFMAAIYNLVEKKGMEYNDAMAEVKRQFIRGDFGNEYRAPFYWAPFVYYGK